MRLIGYIEEMRLDLVGSVADRISITLQKQSLWSVLSRKLHLLVVKTSQHTLRKEILGAVSTAAHWYLSLSLLQHLPTA